MLRDTYSDCAAQADQQTAPIDAQTYDIAQNWHPSGYYDPEALRDIVTKQQALITSAQSTLAQAIVDCTNAVGCGSVADLNDSSDLLNTVSVQAQNYLDAITNAEQSLSAAVQTVYVIAPGVKTWVEDTLTYVSSAMHNASVVECQMPWWASALGALVNLAADFVAACKVVLGVAADVAQAAIDTGKAVGVAAAETVSIIAWTIANLPLVTGFLVLGVLGVWGYRHRNAIKARFTSRGKRLAPQT